MNLVKILFGFGAALLLFGTIRGQSSLQDFFELRQSHKVLKGVVQNLEDQAATLATEITKIKNSPDYAKKVLRDKYHVTEENERIIFFAD